MATGHTETKLWTESKGALSILVLLRIALGWSLLYEGVVKLAAPNWTSKVYLEEARSVLAPLFDRVVADPVLLRIVDLLNMWGLALIGVALILGLFTRTAGCFGLLLISLYYLADPPLIARTPHGEGNYLLVNKNFIEMLALAALMFLPTGQVLGLDGLLARRRSPERRAGTATADEAALPAPPPSAARRLALQQLATIPVLGGVLGTFVYAYIKRKEWDRYEEKHLLPKLGLEVDGVSSATMKTFQFSRLEDLDGELPYGKIGNLEVSRLFLGGNLIGGWAHARDLIYVSKLIKSYHTDEKVFDTLRLAERCGVNTLLTNPQLARVINAYWRKEGGRIQFISDCGLRGNAVEGAKVSVDGGAHACYVQGEISDQAARRGNLDPIAQALDLIRANGLPAGIGAHQLETVRACVEAGLKPDFWVKTLHHTSYWSAKGDGVHDNIWCVNPEETIAFMRDLEEPWIAFKTLAAGAIDPKVGFEYAFKHGADFVCAGMYDFQIVDDVNIACAALQCDLQRERPWRA